MANIPAFMPLDPCKAQGNGLVKIDSRTIGGFAGTFKIEINFDFNSVIHDAPVGFLKISTNLSEGVNGEFKTENILTVNVHGKHNPTLFITSSVDENLPNYKGCKLWLMIANTKNAEFGGNYDVVSFVVHDNKGKLINYGTGVLSEGDIKINGY
jgi:hypothetical protein